MAAPVGQAFQPDSVRLESLTYIKMLGLATVAAKCYYQGMETIKNLSELAPQDLSALERLIGAPLDPSRHQAVAVRVLPVASPTADASAGDTLPEWCNVLEGFSDEDLAEFDSILADRPKLSH